MRRIFFDLVFPAYNQRPPIKAFADAVPYHSVGFLFEHTTYLSSRETSRPELVDGANELEKGP